LYQSTHSAVANSTLRDPVAHFLFGLVGVLIVAAGWSGGRSFSFPVAGWEGPGVDGAAVVAGAGTGGGAGGAAKYSGRQVPLPVAVRDRLGELFADAEFAEAFAVTGPRGWSPGRLALVTVLQMAENLRSVLFQFRTRVAAHGLEEKVLDLLWPGCLRYPAL
jgi:hypothetical protein